eukprot:snap_masked-scaffold_61-processed-gene-0.28-mRNA-1 protein AED:1.00 eAED:1.00 QI:0/0/0/0/1/1/7/0/241
MMKPIKQKYEQKWSKTYFEIQGEKHDEYPNKFKREIEEFVKGFQPDKEVPIIEFDHFPFDAVKSIFVRFIPCFPAVKELNFLSCTFSDDNFKNFKQIKILKLNMLKYFRFKYCNIPEVSSFYSYLKSINIKDIHIYEDFQNKVIVSAIKNYLKTNKTIKSLQYGHFTRFEEVSEEDIIELQEIVDPHPCILGLQVDKIFIEPKGKSKMLKELVHSALQSQYEKGSSLREVPVMEELEKLLY